MKKLLCWIGLHEDRLEDNDIRNKIEIIYRTYKRCMRCKRWGSLIAFKKVDLTKKRGIRFLK